jgi:hypothetical protein
MSIQNSKARRNQRRNQQPKGASMTTATATQPETAQVAEHRWTKAQMRHWNELNADVAQAQADLARAEKAVQRYAITLSEEHDLDDRGWVIGPHGFVLAPPQAETAPPVTDPTATGNEDGAAPPSETTPAA